MLIKDKLVKISGGVAILASAFLFLVVVNKFGTFTETTRTALSVLGGGESSLQASITGDIEAENPTLLSEEGLGGVEEGVPSLVAKEKAGGGEEGQAGALVVEGKFDLERPGDRITTESFPEKNPELEESSDREQSENLIKLHYRGIYQEELKIARQEVILEAKVQFGGDSQWKKVTIDQLDTQEGVAYFLLKKEAADGESFLEQSFTGDYRLIIDEEE